MSPVGVECEQETSFEIEDLFDLVFPDGACGQCAVIFHEFSLEISSKLSSLARFAGTKTSGYVSATPGRLAWRPRA